MNNVAIKKEDGNLISNARELWVKGDWKKLKELKEKELEKENGKEELAVLLVSAFSQLGDKNEAFYWLEKSIEWGLDKEKIFKILVASLENSLGRLAALKNNKDKMFSFFKLSLSAYTSQDEDLKVHARAVSQLADLGLLEQASSLISEKVGEIENKASTTNNDSQIQMLKSEVEMLSHELRIALRRHQLYQGDVKNSDKVSFKEQLRRKSTSQLGQDLWVLEKSDYKRHGFFVEFGATDGVLLSNTYLLENSFNWKGICAEPNPRFFEKLKINRNCTISDACISGETGKDVTFILAEEFGGISDYIGRDKHFEKRAAYEKEGNVIICKTISLNDFLLDNKAPKRIDYLSIDTEGNEFEILENFPFQEWDIRLLTVEHNFTIQREIIFKLMTSHGYKRVESQWDDWYFKC
jgi:FkbM family methyltransferase